MSSSPNASSSRSPRSSATPPPVISEKQKTKPKARDKGNQKASHPTNQAFELRNEGVDPNWAYKPPPGAVLVENKNVDAGNFDWDAINEDDDLELCLIRVPDAIKPKHLQNLPIPTATFGTQTALAGTLKRKTATFDLWSIGTVDDSRAPVGGEEIKSISCLLPRKRKKGRLYPAPKPIAHHLVLAAQAVLPTPPETDGEIDATAVEYTNPPRHSYPTHVLKHRYMPTGSLVKREGEYEVVDVDEPKSTERDVDVEMAILAAEDDEKPTPAVEEASTSQSNKPPSIRRKEKKTKRVDEEAADKSEGMERKEAKKKGRKRKGDTLDDPGEVLVSTTPSKKAKRIKTA